MFVTGNAISTDTDDVTNRLDLDSDNDGISDLRESGATSAIIAFDINNDGTISLAEGTAAAAGGTLNNGVWSFFGADASAGSSDGTTPVNTDGDLVADFVDLDSDGDGIADTIEARPTAGFMTNDGDVSDNDAGR